jgi:phosphatidylinositol alpha-1,6-mannosyltransferase
MRRHATRLLSAPKLGAASGGVGQVSQLVWRAFETTWPGDCELLTLIRNGQPHPALVDKIRFGGTLAHGELRRRFRWVFFTHLGLLRALAPVPRRLRAPYAVFLHGVEAWETLSAADLRLVNDARLRLANSAFTARRARLANPDLGPVDICPLALPPGGAAGAGHHAAAGTPRVLVVGRMDATERYKGHEWLIDSWPRVVAAVPGAELIVVGDGDDRPRLESRARASSASDRIRFTGFVTEPELARQYAGAAVFAMPSRGEGFGLVYLEAMAHGVPCIGSRDDAASEVIVDGETGLLVESARPDSLVDALRTLLSDADLRGRLGEAGRARVHRHFTFETFRGRLIGVLDSAFEAESAGRAPGEVRA